MLIIFTTTIISSCFCPCPLPLAQECSHPEDSNDWLFKSLYSTNVYTYIDNGSRSCGYYTNYTRAIRHYTVRAPRASFSLSLCLVIFMFIIAI